MRLDAYDLRGTFGGERFQVPGVGRTETSDWTKEPWSIARHEDHAASPLHFVLLDS
jgi:hypothetical protein